MRIATIDLDGTPSAALVEDDAVRPLPGVGVLDALAGAIGEAGEPIALGDVRLLSPIEPASVRDFSVFEQHGEGAVKFFAGPDANVQDAWYEGPAFYFSNPHATTGPGDVIEPPAVHSGLDLELEVAAIVGRRGRNVPVEEAGAYIAGYTIFNDWSERDIAAREARLPFGFHKTKDFANTFGPWIVTPGRARALPRRRPARPQDDRLRQRQRAWQRHARVHGVELRGARALRRPRRVDRAGRRHRQRHVRRRLPVRAVGPQPGQGPAAAAGPATRCASRSRASAR